MMGGITMRKFGKKYVEASKKVEKNKKRFFIFLFTFILFLYKILKEICQNKR